jgi:oligopeptide/dipeptide ABC transporter ATP-binding protein
MKPLPTTNGEYNLVELNDLRKQYPLSKPAFWSAGGDTVHAVDGVSFAIRRGEVLGLVGESGCGKSTIGRLLVQLTAPSAGQILFEGRSLDSMTAKERELLKKNRQIIFQDPYSSLNPRMRVDAIISEPMRIAGGFSRIQINTRVMDLVDRVGLARSCVNRFPHEFSGGQRQRIAIARSLALQPKLLVADECVSALDVSVKLQILKLLEDLTKTFDLTLLFISHDLAAVRYLCDRIVVLYLGVVVEIAEKERFFREPLHPYSQALLSAVPTVSKRTQERIVLRGEVPSPVDPPSGCRFRTRCWKAAPICSEKIPPLLDVGNGCLVACHFAKAPEMTA